MTDYGIKREWAQAWNNHQRLLITEQYRHHQVCGSLVSGNADLALHLLAALMREQFMREVETGLAVRLDPRHEYDHAAWLAAARQLMEELGR